jgi:hypothetical protein
MTKSKGSKVRPNSGAPKNWAISTQEPTPNISKLLTTQDLKGATSLMLKRK